MRGYLIALAVSLAGLLAPDVAGAKDQSPFAGMPDAEQKFLAAVLDWKVPDDRPQLLISKGVVLAWLEDPATYLPTPNPRAFYESGKRPLVIVPAGKAIIAFPPRTSDAKSATLGNRLTNTQFQLAVSEDGQWGVIDTNKTLRFFAEPDLWKFSVEEATLAKSAPEGQDAPILGIWNGLPRPFNASGTAGVVVSDGLTTGDTFRVLRFVDDKAIIDFKSDLPDIRRKRLEIEMETASAGAKPGDTFEIPIAGVQPLQIGDKLVPNDSLNDWRSGNADYSKIFRFSFSNIRVPSSTTMTVGCGLTTQFSTTDTSGMGVSFSGDQGAGGTWWGILTAKIAFSENAKKQIEETKGSSLTEKSFLRRYLYPVEYHSPDGNSDFFWAGTATTCSKTKPNWTTVMVRQGESEHFLDREFYSWAAATEAEPAELQRPQNDPLAGVAPGGNPLDRDHGVFNILCVPQQDSLEAAATAAMHDATWYSVQIAVALLSGFPSASAPSLSQYYSLKGCARAPARTAALPQ